jgi:hypothetical protein
VASSRPWTDRRQTGLITGTPGVRYGGHDLKALTAGPEEAITLVAAGSGLARRLLQAAGPNPLGTQAAAPLSVVPLQRARPSASIPTYFSMRRLLVSGFLACASPRTNHRCWE